MELIESVVKHYVLDGVPEIGLLEWRLSGGLTMSTALLFVDDLYKHIDAYAQNYGSIEREPRTGPCAKTIKEAFNVLMADRACWPGE